MWKNLLKILIILILFFLTFVILMLIGNSQIHSFINECIRTNPDNGNVTLILVKPFEYAYYHFVLMLAAAVYAAIDKKMDKTIRRTLYILPILNYLLVLPIMHISFYIAAFLNII